MSPTKKVPIIISAVCSEYDLPIERITNPANIEQRNVAMYLIRQETKYTYDWIGKKLGRSSSVVDHAIKLVSHKLYSDHHFNRRISKILAILPELYKQNK